MLRLKMLALPEPPQGEWPNWNHWRKDLRDQVLTDDPNNFVEWPTVRHCMMSDWFSINEAWELVRQHLDRYEPIMRFPVVGKHDDFQGYSRNLVKMAGWLCYYEQTTGKRIDELTSIYEFGGGFGAFALACARLGFRGHYTIFDYPEMLLLQEWFLQKHGITVSLISNPAPVKADLFVACCSISEAPLKFRNRFMQRVDTDSYLIEWNDRYWTYNNVKWFGKFFKRTGMNWDHWLQEERKDVTVSVGWK